MLLDKDSVIATVITHINLLCVEKNSDTWKFAEQLIKAFESVKSESAGSVSCEAHRPDEEKLKKIAKRLTDRFYNNIVSSEDDAYFKVFYDGLYQDVLQELINVSVR